MPFRLLRRAVSWPFLLIGGVALSLLALFGRHGPRSWSVFLRGSVHPRPGEAQARLLCRSERLGIDRDVSGIDGYCVLAEGRPGEALAPAGLLSIELRSDADAPAPVCEIDLSRLLAAPLQGYVELLVDREAVTARVMQYTWGGSLAWGTGQTHRRTRKLNEIRIAFASRAA